MRAMAKKVSAKGQRPSQELGIGPGSEPYLLVTADKLTSDKVKMTGDMVELTVDMMELIGDIVELTGSL